MHGRAPARSTGSPAALTATVARRREPWATVHRRAPVAVLCVALLATACGPGQAAESAPVASEVTQGAVRSPTASAPPTATARPTTPAASDTAVSAPVCDPVERPRLQAGAHVIGDREPPVPYSSRPPTSGWHASGHVAVDVRDADDPLTEPEQVSVLEVGGVVVTHGALPDDQAAELADHVDDHHAGRVAVTPYPRLADGHVAFTGWGVLQRCDRVDLAALDRFVDRVGPDAPVEPGH